MRDHSLEDPVVLVDFAYVAIVQGNADEALAWLQDAIASESEDEYANDELVAQLEYMRDVLRSDGLNAAQAQLQRWRTRNIRALKLVEPS
jgi:hypothetical protein